MGISRTATGRATRVSGARRKPRSKWVKFVKQTLAYLTLFFLIGTIVLGVLFWQELGVARESMATLREKMAAVRKPPSIILAADGKTVLYRVTGQYRKVVPLKDVPKRVVNAVLAAEDKRFYDHTGVDITSLTRVAYTGMRDKKFISGGSTLTMQMAKRLYTGTERTFQRKIKDIALAWTMERELSKEEILDLYLNEVYFGEGAYGIGAAAEVYFGKELKELTIGEAAMLARCVRRPSDQTPFKNLRVATQNRDVVLAIMREEGLITESEYRKAKAEKPKLNPNPPAKTGEIAPHGQYFTYHVLELFKQEYPGVDLAEGGYTIHTTLDYQLQKVAEREVARVVNRYRRSGLTTGSFLVVNKNGHILCEVGGVSFKRNQTNMIWQGTGRQPGSSFKPFVYAAALHTGAIQPRGSVDNGNVFIEQPGRKPYTPEGGGPRGYVSLRSAVAQSYNRAAVNVIQKLGYETAVNYGRDVFGFRSKLQPVPSLALGVSEVKPLELAEGYSVFMLRGDRVRPYPIVRVHEPDGKIRRFEPTRFSSVLDPVVCQEIDDLLRSVVTSGTGRIASVVPNARGKTGTTQEGKDAWFCGYADGLIGIGWVANEQRVGNRWKYFPMPSVYGGKITSQIWAGVMKEAWAKHKSPVTDLPNGEVLNAWDAEGRMLRERRRQRDNEERRRNEEPQDEGSNDITVEPTDPVPSDPAGEPAPAPVDPAINEPTPAERPRTEDREPAPEPTRERPRRRQEEPRREDNYTEVEVCADSGQRASLYCPETVPRRYARGGGPRRRCRLHSGGG